MTILRITSFLLALTAGLAAQAKDWNQWRGPARDGVATFTPPAAWPEQPKQMWKVPAGIGHASPVVSGNRIYLFSRVGEQEALTAFDAATGKQVWRQAYDAPYQMNPAATGHGKGPKSTPLVAGGRIFTFGISGILTGTDAATGRTIWRKDPAKEFKVTAPDFGASASPLLDGDRVIVHLGGPQGSALAAFHVATGRQAWAWTADGPAYASPVIGTFGGARHLVTQTQSHVVGISPEDGRELWKVRFTTDYDQNIITPVIANGMLIYAGLNKPTTAVKPVQQGGGWKLETVWQNPEIPMYMSSPVAVGNVLYGLTHRNRGQFFAVDLASGKALWVSPPRQGDNAALTAAGPQMIATTTEGKIVVFRQGTSAYEVVREYTVGDSPIWAHPAFHGRGIIVKDAENLSSWTF